jgi:hypothetical protein
MRDESIIVAPQWEHSLYAWVVPDYSYGRSKSFFGAFSRPHPRNVDESAPDGKVDLKC